MQITSDSDLDMNFNTSKSYTMIFEPFNRTRRVTFEFPSLALNASQLCVVSSFKYLGHILSASTADNDDIAHQMSLLYARANVLIRKFSKCSRNVKLCLFRGIRSTRGQTKSWTTNSLTNQLVDKPIRGQTNSWTSRLVDKPTREQ